MKQEKKTQKGRRRENGIMTNWSEGNGRSGVAYFEIGGGEGSERE